MTREEAAKMLSRYARGDTLIDVNDMEKAVDAAIDHLTRDTYRERLDRMVAVTGLALGPADAVKLAVQFIAAIDAEVERKAGEP